MKHIFDDADKNKYEAYTKEEVLEVIQEAISSGELPEEINGLVLRFKNPVDNQSYKIAFCTQAKYNELESGGQLEANCIYYITDDSTLDDINDKLDDLDNDVDDLKDAVFNGNLNVNQILSLINNTTSDKSKWIFTPKYSYHNFEVGTDTDDVLEAVIKQLCIDYPNKEHITFFGTIEPNSTGIYFLHIYNTSDLTNGLPRYAMGLYIGNECICNFGTWEYSFLYVNTEEKITNLESKHLYRHDIKIIGTGYGVYFTLYLSTNASITSANVTDYIQTGKTINASGYHSQDYATGVCPINDVHNTSGTLNASYIRYKEYHPNWETEEWNQSLTNGTYTDTITQIF